MRKTSTDWLIHTLVIAVFAVQPAAAQCREDCTSPDTVCICAVESDLQGAGAKAEAFVTRLGSPDREPAKFRTSVRIGDLLEGTGDGAAVELSCPKGSSVKFSNAFRAVLLPPGEGQDCAFSLLSGGVDVLTGEPTEVRSGLVVMGSKRTNYGLNTYRRGEKPGAEALVYEGAAECQASPQGRKLNVGPGEKMLLGEGKWIRSTITPRDIERGANLFARLDIAKSRAFSGSIRNPQAAYASLKAIYSTVLRRPSDSEARTQLAIQQVNLKLPANALYHLNKIDESALQGRQRAVISVTRAFAYQELGQVEKAEQHFNRAKQIDPEAVESFRLREHKFDERFLVQRGLAPTLNRPMVVKAVARPQSVAPGSRTQIIVEAVSREGKPVSGVEVKVKAGGGAFPTGRTEVGGRTDSRGLFQTTWFCRPCAPAYVLGVEAAKAGYQAGSAQVRVEITQR